MNTETCSRVQSLIDKLSPVQLVALETILRSMLDPLSLKLALAPLDDEPVTEEGRQSVAEADEWRKYNQPIPAEEVLADFGLTMGDWQAMAKTPLDESVDNPREKTPVRPIARDVLQRSQ